MTCTAAVHGHDLRPLLAAASALRPAVQHVAGVPCGCCSGSMPAPLRWAACFQGLFLNPTSWRCLASGVLLGVSVALRAAPVAYQQRTCSQLCVGMGRLANPVCALLVAWPTV